MKDAATEGGVLMNWLMTIIWLLPILFMIHDFEEIIMVNAWREKKAKVLIRLKRKPFGEFSSTPAISCAILEEFLLLSVLSFISIYYESYIVFYGIFFAYTVHLVFHIVLSIRFKGYVPGIVTSILQLPICVYFLGWLYVFIPITIAQAVISSIIGTIVLLGNVLFLHTVMPKFDQWIRAYRAQPDGNQ